MAVAGQERATRRSPMRIRPTFSVVEYASSTFRSVSTSACRIPNSADTAPSARTVRPHQRGPVPEQHDPDADQAVDPDLDHRARHERRHMAWRFGVRAGNHTCSGTMPRLGSEPDEREDEHDRPPQRPTTSGAAVRSAANDSLWAWAPKHPRTRPAPRQTRAGSSPRTTCPRRRAFALCAMLGDYRRAKLASAISSHANRNVVMLRQRRGPRPG